MSKGLEELSYIKENHLQLAKEKYRKLEPKALEDVLTRKAKHYDIIEKELKDVDEIMSNHNCSDLIELNEKLCDYEELKFDDDIKQQKLKALEIIKENLVVGYDESENDKSCLTLGIKINKDKLIVVYETFDKEKIDLLREVLL